MSPYRTRAPSNVTAAKWLLRVRHMRDIVVIFAATISTFWRSGRPAASASRF